MGEFNTSSGETQIPCHCESFNHFAWMNEKSLAMDSPVACCPFSSSPQPSSYQRGENPYFICLLVFCIYDREAVFREQVIEVLAVAAGDVGTEFFQALGC